MYRMSEGRRPEILQCPFGGMEVLSYKVNRSGEGTHGRKSEGAERALVINGSKSVDESEGPLL